MLRFVSVRLRSQAGLNLVLSAALALTSLSFTPPRRCHLQPCLPSLPVSRPGR